MDYVERLKMIETWANEWKLTGHRTIVHGGLMVEAWIADPRSRGWIRGKIRVEPSGEQWVVTKTTFPTPGVQTESRNVFIGLEHALDEASDFLRDHA